MRFYLIEGRFCPLNIRLEYVAKWVVVLNGKMQAFYRVAKQLSIKFVSCSWDVSSALKVTLHVSRYSDAVGVPVAVQ